MNLGVERGVQGQGAGSSQPVRQNLEDRRVQRARGFIEGDTEPGKPPSPPHCQGLLDTRPSPSPAPGQHKGNLTPDSSEVPKRASRVLFRRGLGRGDKGQPLPGSHGQSRHTGPSISPLAGLSVPGSAPITCSSGAGSYGASPRSAAG